MFMYVMSYYLHCSNTNNIINSNVNMIDMQNGRITRRESRSTSRRVKDRLVLNSKPV